MSYEVEDHVTIQLHVRDSQSGGHQPAAGPSFSPQYSRNQVVSLGETELRDAWRRLHGAHALVLDEDGEIRIAHPFSAVPTVHRVEAAGRSWYANCPWDSFGICAALGADGHVVSSCPDCGAQIELDVRDGRPDADETVVHLLVPAERWWDDIAFT